MKIKRPRQHFDLVEVLWDDASAIDGGWVDKDEEYEVSHKLVLSVGFLTQETPEHIIISLDTDNEGAKCGSSQIPRGMVKKIRVLRKKDNG